MIVVSDTSPLNYLILIGRVDILRVLFGSIYVGIPHYFCLIFRQLASSVLGFLAWFAILFAGKYPEKWHAFNVGTYRWSTRINLYLGYFTDTYPVFSGKE